MFLAAEDRSWTWFSHADNAWLATEVRAGHAPGLSIVTVWTNAHRLVPGDSD